MSAKMVNAACNGAMMGGMIGLILVIAMPMFAILGAIVLPASLTEVIVKTMQTVGLTSVLSRPVFFAGICVGFSAATGAVYYSLLEKVAPPDKHVSHAAPGDI